MTHSLLGRSPQERRSVFPGHAADVLYMSKPEQHGEDYALSEYWVFCKE